MPVLETVRMSEEEEKASKYRALLIRGGRFLKYGRRGKPHFTYVSCSEELVLVRWRNDEKSKKFKSVASNDIQQIVVGRVTPVFKKAKCDDEKQNNRSFSVSVSVGGRLSLFQHLQIALCSNVRHCPPPYLSLSIYIYRIYVQLVFSNRTLDLEADTVESLEKWVEAFKWLAAYVARISTGVPYNFKHVTHVDGDLQWTGQVKTPDLFELTNKLGEVGGMLVISLSLSLALSLSHTVYPSIFSPPSLQPLSLLFTSLPFSHSLTPPIYLSLPQGSFGEVYRAVHKKGGFEIAVKIVLLGDQEEAETIQSEIDILKQCRHRSIVSYFGCFADDESESLFFFAFSHAHSLSLSLLSLLPSHSLTMMFATFAITQLPLSLYLSI